MPDLQPLKRSIIMLAGASGWATIRGIPAGYKFVSIYNPTINEVEIYDDLRTERDNKDILKLVPINTVITVPISNTDFSIYYTNGGGAEDKKIDFTFTVENLNQNGALGSTMSASVNIGSDSVGLAKEIQFPADLSAGGSFKTVINEPLPAGTNEIGTVNIGTMPAVSTVDESSMTQVPETNQLAISTVEVPLRAGAGDLAGRKQLAVSNLDASAAIYVGKSGVTALTGFPIPAGGSFVFPINPSNSVPIYAIAAAGSVTVAVMEVK